MTNKQVVLFGASKGGESFITHNPNLNIVAVADNDPKKWGNKIAGIPIINPKNIPSYSYDILIIASLWFEVIKEQLVNEINIDENKIIAPEKKYLKSSDRPFEQPQTLELAQESIGVITNFLDQHKVKAILDFGTALGVVRDGDLIPWDDDVDIAIIDKEFDIAVSLSTKLTEKLPLYKGAKWECFIYSHEKEDICINLELSTETESELRPFIISLVRRNERNGMSYMASSSGMFYAPAVHFKTPVKSVFFNQEIYLPNKVEELLSFVYGEWKSPKQNYTFSDYKNINTTVSSNAGQVSKRVI